MNLFENSILEKGVLFYQLAELFPSFSQLGEEEEHSFQWLYLHIAFRNLVYVKNVYCGCFINTTFTINKEVVQILWTILWLFLWGIRYILPASYLLWKISQPDENWWGTPFLRNSSGVLFIIYRCLRTKCLCLWNIQLFLNYLFSQ